MVLKKKEKITTLCGPVNCLGYTELLEFVKEFGLWSRSLQRVWTHNLAKPSDDTDVHLSTNLFLVITQSYSTQIHLSPGASQLLYVALPGFELMNLCTTTLSSLARTNSFVNLWIYSHCNSLCLYFCVYFFIFYICFTPQSVKTDGSSSESRSAWGVLHWGVFPAHCHFMLALVISVGFLSDCLRVIHWTVSMFAYIHSTYAVVV